MTNELPTPEGPFVCTSANLDAATGEVALEYAIDDLRFVERLSLGAPPVGLDDSQLVVVRRLLAYLHAVAGVSYYKALIPRGLDLRPTGLDPAAAAFVEHVYLFGLGEFAHRNGLDLRDRLQPQAAATRLEPVDLSLPRRSLVPIGGGKDSLVTLEALRAAGEPVTPFAVNPRGPIIATIAASGLASLTIRRQLDPLLFELNARGAWNGHVPITAIVSLAALVTAAWHGFDRVVMSNERSADVGNLEAAGLAVNHQWSKSFAFESDLRAELVRAVSPDLSFFSLLRPWSELAIAHRFAAVDRYDAAFSSCNRNFHLNGEGPAGRWCRDCPKCRFVFLVLAPFVERDRLLAMVGGDLLDDPAQIDGFAELAGLQGHKPFECVGETGEAAAALALLATRPEWLNGAVVRALDPMLAPRRAELLRYFRSAQEPSGPHAVPPELDAVLRA
ncbi:MAG: hypothetical protein AAFX81_07200 [Pseudomonadota bacterium]